MPEFKNEEAFRVWLINNISEKFPDNAILKGGMTLRLLECPRYTNDLDYTFIPYKSKKELSEPIIGFLESLKNINIDHVSLNSKCLRIIVSAGNFKSAIEINVEKECPYEALSTSSLSRQVGLTGRIIKVMPYSYSLSNKLGAWLERNLARDLYDIYYYLSILNVRPDIQQLKKRLDKINYSRAGKQPKKMNLIKFISYVKSKAISLTANDIKELDSILSDDELPGLELKIKRALNELAIFLNQR